MVEQKYQEGIQNIAPVIYCIDTQFYQCKPSYLCFKLKVKCMCHTSVDICADHAVYLN